MKGGDDVSVRSRFVERGGLNVKNGFKRTSSCLGGGEVGCITLTIQMFLNGSYLPTFITL